MRFGEAHAAVQDAKRTLDAADEVAIQMASMLRGRLRHCGGADLAALKRELRDFNIHTHRWSEK